MKDLNASGSALLRGDSALHARRTAWIIGAVALALGIAGATVWQRMRADANGAHGGKGGSAQRAVPVGVATAVSGDIDVYQDGLGTVVPRNVVTVHTRVNGQLMRVLFKEGQLVKAGQLLAEIDPRPYQVLLTTAEGQMARDRALLENARVDLGRYKTLFAQESISQQQLATQAALVRQNEGTVLADKGQVDSAKLSLVYTRITSPLTGRVGLRQVDPGNIVQSSDPNGLVVITQIQPMTVIFTVPETRLTAIVPRLYAGGTLSVEAWDRNNKVKLAIGTLAAADNQIDTNTGTVKLRAVFNNEKSQLFPNEFVNARVLIDREHDATIIPAAAVQAGTIGPFVYLVQPNQTVAVQPVSLGPAEGASVAIDKGIAPGDVVVVDGTDSLRSGTAVQPVMRAAPPARRPQSGNEQPSGE